MHPTSPWEPESGRVDYPTLDAEIEVDVAIVGGGIAGVTTAYELAKAGKKVALIEQDRIGGGMTGLTTAFVTYMTDAYLADLERTFGAERAALVWTSCRQAVDELERIIKTESIDCDFARCPGYTYAPDQAGLERLRREEELAKRFGFPVRLGHDLVGFAALGVLRVEQQAKFQPMKFLLALAERTAALGARIYENSKVISYAGGPVHSVKSSGGAVRAKQVVLATHTPIGDPGFLSLGSAAYQTYVIEAEIPSGLLPEAIFQDTLKPYHYFRVDKAAGHDRIILGGEDHRTGQSDGTEARFTRLESFLQKLLPGKSFKVVKKWSGEVLETIDGLPYIGSAGKGLFVSTGFSGTGMSFGMLSAMITRDLVLGRANAVTKLYGIWRFNALWRMLDRGSNFVTQLVKGWVVKADRVLDDIKPDEGAVVTIRGKNVAAYRTAQGKLLKLSPICTHLGCTVQWNSAGKSWDCPCHGSRFKKDGEVLNGPASAPLKKL